MIRTTWVFSVSMSWCQLEIFLSCHSLVVDADGSCGHSRRDGHGYVQRNFERQAAEPQQVVFVDYDLGLGAITCLAPISVYRTGAAENRCDERLLLERMLDKGKILGELAEM